MMHFISLLLVVLSMYSCRLNEQKAGPTHEIEIPANQLVAEQIGEYVVSTFEDSKKNLWFGTMSKGVARYDGKNLHYFTVADGLAGNSVVDMLEDDNGILWFATHSGLTKYDGDVFTRYTQSDGLIHDRVSQLFIDSKNRFWIGTWGGVSLFDGSTFTDFDLPYPHVETPLNVHTKNWVTEIMEDKDGIIWIGRDGYGICKYDGSDLSYLLTDDGLLSNHVQSVTEDDSGNIWIGTRVAERNLPHLKAGAGGLVKYTDSEPAYFEQVEGLYDNDVYGTYQDVDGMVWVTTISNGVYVFEGESMRHFDVKLGDQESSVPVQNILKDSRGFVWFGCSGGLYRLKDDVVENITTTGPWD